MRYSTISPQLGDIGAQAPTNEHIDRLGAILLTYNFYEKELGTLLPWIHSDIEIDLNGQAMSKACLISVHLSMS